MQNEELKKQLLETSGTVLVEASPRDRKWGIGKSLSHTGNFIYAAETNRTLFFSGIGLTNPSINDRKAWRGKNLLGTILMEVRTELADQ